MQSHLRPLLLSQEDQVGVGEEVERMRDNNSPHCEQGSRSQQLQRAWPTEPEGAAEHRLWRQVPANLGYRLKGQNKVPPHRAVEKGRIEPLVGERVRRTVRSRTRRQPRDRSGQDGAASGRAPHMPRGSCGFVKVHYPLGVLCFKLPILQQVDVSTQLKRKTCQSKG